MSCRGLHFKIIDKCNSRCDHCSYCSSDDLPGIMDFEFFKGILSSYEGNLEWLSILGGEPFLHPDLVDFVDEACKASVDRVWLYTNGFWGDSEKSKMILTQLKTAGLKYLAISSDFFHDKHVPLSTI
ncbi:MAG: radical SAM protein, partial [Candidatus Hodarchaeales archaeon]